MIAFTGLYKKLGSFEIKDFTAEIPEGCICGLAGRNGAGKTSVLNLLLGLLKPDEGEITIDGMEYENAEKEIRKLFGYVLVDELFMPQLSPEDNGDHFGSFYEAYSSEDYRKYLEMFRISGKKHFRVLSKGEKLKCQFAFALSHSAKYLILDEPTANFDPEFRKDFWRLLQDFTSNGINSVLLATHLTDDLDRMADRLILMDTGQALFDGDMENFRNRYRILSGEKYLLKQLPKENVVNIEEGSYSSSALVISKYGFPKELTNRAASIEDFMYHYSKRGKQK